MCQLPCLQLGRKPLREYHTYSHVRASRKVTAAGAVQAISLGHLN